MSKKVIVLDVDGVILSEGKLIPDTLNFIVANYEKYDFFTNTTFTKLRLQKIFSNLDIGKYFLELLAYEDGTKRENISYIMQVYDVIADDTLFIDDTKTHINAVKSLGVHTLLFKQDGVSLQEKINKKLNL